jgi:hypothetical protein
VVDTSALVAIVNGEPDRAAAKRWEEIGLETFET